MNNQDKRKSLTAEELRQRYNFEDIAKTKKATELIKETLNKVEVQFQRFIDIIKQSLSEYPSQADGNITAWFFNGIPTTTQPEYTTPLDHLGDVYYDRDSGKAYKYKITDVFDKNNPNIINTKVNALTIKLPCKSWKRLEIKSLHIKEFVFIYSN